MTSPATPASFFHVESEDAAPAADDDDGRAERAPTREGEREPLREPADRKPADREVFFLAALLPPRGFGRARRVLFGAALRVLFGAAFRFFGAALRVFFGAALRVLFGTGFRAARRFPAVVRLRAVLRLRDDPREVLRALRVRPPEGREAFREPPRLVFLAFLAT